MNLQEPSSRLPDLAPVHPKIFSLIKLESGEATRVAAPAEVKELPGSGRHVGSGEAEVIAEPAW